ncbi:class I SAM-dependent methyltransferase [bacterium]|nr:class I SAM-dependent methyltransferase [bacterium]
MNEQLPSDIPLMYSAFADWWPLLSAPQDYAEEADIFLRTIRHNSLRPVKTVLELGSGGGNNASHLKKHFTMTLVDRAENMLEVSRRLNPELEHIRGDMRKVRLGRTFDCVFIHDAISYIKTELDLAATFATAFSHLEPGGVALFTPDHVRENFRAQTSHGGHDGPDRAMRYLEWVYDPDPTDTSYLCDFAYIHRDHNGHIQCSCDRHQLGLFSRQVWLRLIAEAGFRAQALPFEHSELEPGSCEYFIGIKESPKK